MYASAVPDGVHTIFRGYGANRSTDRRSDSPEELAAIEAVPELDAPTETWFPWSQIYESDEWLEQLRSRSDHTALDADVQAKLFEGIRAVIDDFGGSFVMEFETVLITASRLP